ncbi:centrosomal protein of 295 kDa isoform X2 [Dasypus novemcinctus]|uniref:centrosomal protein of 295 kDa isoform X2 n=1 Tax=Dasypus novemcinctus TaxID=9361 RepID=UPI0039C9E781
MKRKVVNAGKLRLSPNEEAFILKEDYERRRKLRLLQVREQERDIALQIREDIKQRRYQQFTRLAEELRAEWEESQTQKVKSLEKLYLASLRNVGEGHRQAKENEPDLEALAWQATERKRRAEVRHKEALKEQKNKKEILMKQKTRHIKARKKALLVEKERSSKITSLPPPPPSLFENIEVKRISSVKTSSSTYHHLYTLVNREVDTEQPDAHLAAEEEAKRLEELQKQVAQERMEQFEKAHVRGFQAMKKIHFAQNQEKLMKELKQLQQEDLARRRQTVARMPQQLVELPYKRNEMKEDWQRELEFAFEDMYNADRKVKGNLILHLEPEPLPTVIDQTQDDELDLSMEQENLSETESLQVTETEELCSSETNVPLTMKTQQVPSKILFKKLLNKIRSQISLRAIKSMSADESEVITAVDEMERKTPIQSETIASEERTLLPGKEQVTESDILTIESGPLTSEDKPLSCSIDSGKEQEINETQPTSVVAQSLVLLLHPQEETTKIRISARQKQIMEIEEQKQKQLELLEQIEQQKLRLETDCFRAHLEEEKRKNTQQPQVGIVSASCAIISDEESHRQMIRNYQHQLLEQNRLHRQSVETARKQLHEYQSMLKERYPSMLATSLTSHSVLSVPPQKSERPNVTSEHWNHSERPKLHPNKYQPIQISKLEQDHFQVPKQNLFPQRQMETTEVISTSDVLAKQSLELQGHLRLFSQTETQQRDYKLVPEDSYRLSRALSHDRLLRFEDAKKIPQTPRVTAFQTIDSQRMFLENGESMSSKLTEPLSFLPLAAEHSFSSLPAKTESGGTQEPFSARKKSPISFCHSGVSQMHGRSFPSSQQVGAEQSNLKTLQEELDLQREVLQTRQEAQEQLLMCKQKELEEQIGLSLFLPLVASLPSAEAELGRIHESSPTKEETAVSSGHLMVPQFQNRLLSVSQPILAQEDNVKFPQEQLNIQRDSLHSRQGAQEVFVVPEQKELDRRVSSLQAEPSSVPSQVAQDTSSPSAEIKSGKVQEHCSPKSEEGILSSQSEIPKSQDRSLSFQQQFLPLHESLHLLQEPLIALQDTLQARHEAQVELLLYGQKDLGDNKSEQMGSSSSAVAAQCSVAPQTSIKAEPRRIQKLYLSDKEDTVPSSHLVIPTFQNKSLGFPHHSLPQQENLTVLQEQSHIQKVMFGAKQETQEFVDKQCELEKIISSEQTGPSSSLSQGAKSEALQELMSIKSENTVPLSHSKNSRFQESLLRFSEHTLPLQGRLDRRQERLDTEKKVLHFSQKPQENLSSERTASSSFIPRLEQLSFTSLPSAGTIQEPFSIESDSKIPSSYFQIPQLQDRLLRISQCICPQQDNLKALQEHLAMQREAIIQSRREAQEELLLHKQREWKERISPEHVGTSSFLPLVAQHSFASLPLTESERIEEPFTTKNDNRVSSHYSEIPRLPDRLWGLSQSVLPQQDNSITFQEHLHARTNALGSSEKTEKELVLPRQCEFEEKISSDQFIQPHCRDLKALQEQLDIQRKAIRSSQEVQEELILQRLCKLEKRVSPEKISSSFLLRIPLPIANSERTQEPFSTKSKGIPSSHPEMPGSQGGLLRLSQPILAQQDSLTALKEQSDFQREVVSSNEKAQEEMLLNKPSKLNKSDSSKDADPSLFLHKETEHFFFPFPFAEAKSESICELYSSENEHIPPFIDSTSRVQDRFFSFSQPILAQQDNFGFQKQLDLQRKVLHYGQRAQKELLVQRQTSLQQQIQKHQETLKAFFKDNQTCKPKVENDIRTQKMEQLREWFPHLEDPAQDAQEGIRHADGSSSDDNQLLSGDAATQSGEHLGRRSSKPPLAKVKCGLDLNQHELSAIQEVESPGSGKTSIPGKTEFYQDRDPMRVSISREQSLLGSSLDGDPFGHLQPVAQKNAYGDCDEAVTVKESVFENCGVFSYAVEKEQCTHLSPAVKPDCKGKALEISYEPLSSVTVSTGSFLSCENPDLSLTDPVPTVDLDFPELEHTFPNFHRQLFKPLEPHPDSDLSSSSSGISQENPDISKSSNSSSESHHAALSSRSTVSSTALRRTSSHSFLKADLNQQLDPNSVGAAAQSFATKNIEGCEQPFQQLLPGFSSQERSQHPDLPSIFSIEARDPSQGMENQNYSSEQSEILQIKKKGVHFQPSVENLPSSVFSSSDEAHVFDQLNVQHSTPCCSTSSDCSMKEQLESRKERQCFEELLEKGVDTRLERQGFIKDDNNRSCRVLGVNPTEETDSQLWVRTVEMGTPQSLTMQNENYFENSAKTETPEILRNPSPLAPSECFVSSGSLSIQSSIPVWETASGHGIMEEPELTFSNSDISVAETDFESLTLEEKREYKAKSFQVGEFLPLVPETETSDSPAISENSGTMGPPQPAETLVPKCTVIPGSLQEAFLIRKKPFITKSSQRQKEIKNKVRVSENSPGSPVSHLRRVASRVCLPEDRKTQEAYAQNRARAKEFHKKTLEKLRAKNAF